MALPSPDVRSVVATGPRNSRQDLRPSPRSRGSRTSETRSLSADFSSTYAKPLLRIRVMVVIEKVPDSVIFWREDSDSRIGMMGKGVDHSRGKGRDKDEVHVRS
jgi:hypothetical protein